MIWWTMVIVGISIGAPIEGVDCVAFDAVIEAHLKSASMSKAEIMGERDSATELSIANDLTLIGLNLDLMKAVGCPLRLAPITGGEYILNALECQKVLERQPLGQALKIIPPACDQSTWRRLMPDRRSSATLSNRAEELPSATAPPYPKVVTLEKFQKILEGMTYDEVVAIIGAQGGGPTPVTDGTSTSEIFVWSDGPDAAKISVAFQNGKVIWKTKLKIK